MPIYDIQCKDCDYTGEVLVLTGDGAMPCPACGSPHTAKLMSVASSLTGREGQRMPGAKDTACCGSQPGQGAGCIGPGSCCGQK